MIDQTSGVTTPATGSVPASEPEVPAVKPEGEAASVQDGQKPDEAAEVTDQDASEAGKVLNAAKSAKRDRYREMEARASGAERREKQLLTELQQLREKAATPPDPSKYDDIGQYEQDKVEHALTKHETGRLERQVSAAAAETAQAIEDAWTERCADFRLEAPDFDQVVLQPSSLPISKELAADLKAMPEGPQVAYYLAKKPSEARRLSSLSDRQRAFELGKLVADQAAKTMPRRTTQAPPPITGAVTGKSAPTTKWANLSAAEYAKAVREEMKR